MFYKTLPLLPPRLALYYPGEKSVLQLRQGRRCIGLITMPPGKTASPLVVIVLSTFFLGRTMGELPEYPLTFNEMKILAGYYNAKGRYKGGIPKAKDEVRSSFGCDTTNVYVPTTSSVANDSNTNNTNATACMEWDEHISSTHHCECNALAANEEYCSGWICHLAATYEKVCDGRCMHDVYVTGYKACQCNIENNSSTGSGGGLFCDAWSCSQSNSVDISEEQEFDCQRVSPSGRFCEAWNGHVTATESVKVVACECTEDLNGDGSVCASWECATTELTKCARHTFCWCSYTASVLVGGMFGMIGVLLMMVGIVSLASEKDKVRALTHSLCPGLLWCCAWSVAVVVWGGEDGATAVGVLWGLPLTVTAVLTVHDKRNGGCQGNGQLSQAGPEAALVGDDVSTETTQAVGNAS